ncbi:hypothetical protein Ancab_010672 [Ancistrocladus abbreviatus]
MEAQEGNSSDIRRPETEVGSANASNTSNFIEDFNDGPSNQGDFDHSAIDPSVPPSKKVRSKVWDHLIKICAENLKDQRAKCKYCGAILGADPAKEICMVMFLSDDRVKGSVSLEDQSMTKFPDGKPSTTTTPSFLIRSAAECDDEAKSAGLHEIPGHIQVIPMSNM